MDIRWRLKSFWQPFWRFLVWGDSAWGKAIKVIGLLLFIGGPSVASFWESPGYIYLYGLNQQIISTPLKFTAFLPLLLAGFWIVFAAGRAWELAGVPELIIADHLIADEVVENQIFFRLEIESREKDFDTTVRLIKVLDTNYKHLLPGRFPIELEWSNHPGETSIHLSADVKESVSLALMRRRTLGDFELIYTGVRHKGEIKLAVGERAYFHLRIDHRKRKPIERWFWFEKKSNSSFSFESCAKPEAIPATSKRAE